jgi:hypothetical protein
MDDALATLRNPAAEAAALAERRAAQRLAGLRVPPLERWAASLVSVEEDPNHPDRVVTWQRRHRPPQQDADAAFQRYQRLVRTVMAVRTTARLLLHDVVVTFEDGPPIPLRATTFVEVEVPTP